jgi:hypothetical protein
MVVAIIEPTATVIAKSKLDIFEKLLLPTIRVRIITAAYIPMLERIIATSDGPEISTSALLKISNFS